MNVVWLALEFNEFCRKVSSLPIVMHIFKLTVPLVLAVDDSMPVFSLCPSFLRVQSISGTPSCRFFKFRLKDELVKIRPCLQVMGFCFS